MQIADLRRFPANAPSDELAAAWAINNGTDLEMGSCLPLMRCNVANGCNYAPNGCNALLNLAV